MHLSRTFAALAVCAALVPASALALGKKNTGSTQILNAQASTQAVYQDRGFWLPGKWTVANNTASGSVTLTRGDDKRIVVSLVPMDRQSCAYGFIRQAALKAWGGTFQLDGAKSRIEPINFGTSKFTGYTWVVPSDWKGTRHWCLGQDLKSAVEVTAPEGAADVVSFIRQDMMLQLAVRRGRSVLPFPAASGSSSSVNTDNRTW